jgi:cyclophilin family peptidyl-prolyl cis-trans isomerase
MPHTSKKYRKQNAAAAKGGRTSRTTLFVVIAVVAVIAVAGGYYVLSSAQKTTTNSTQTISASTASTACSTSSVTPQNGLLYAKLNTSQGMFEVELFSSLTPKTVANFVSLAQSCFYNNLVWHRISKGFVIQTGDPDTRNGAGSPCTWGQHGSTTTIPFESAPTLTNGLGYLGMASTGAKTPGTSQFYINLGNNTNALDDNYAVFGKVISGMNVVDAIGNLSISSACGSSTDGPPANPSQAMLISVTIQNTP